MHSPKRLPALRSGVESGSARPGCISIQSDWRSKIELSVTSAIGSCTIRPQAAIDLLEQETQLQESLRAAIEVDRELRAGQHLALKLE
jgi:hypothetical protein